MLGASAAAHGQSHVTPLPSDLTRDCQIDFHDFAVLASAWLDSDHGISRAGADRTDLTDLAALSEDWLAEPNQPCNECDNWREEHPEWIFCDDFEDDTPLRREGRYFEISNDEGDFAVQDGVGLDNSRGMRVRFQEREVSAGALHLAFGRVPGSYFDKGIRANEDFRDVYYRMYLRHQPGWQGSPAKLSRAFIFAGADFSQAMIAHLWSAQDFLLIDPASGVDADGNVVTTRYNDFENLSWLGNLRGVTPIFASDHAGKWFCIEVHVRLNDPGRSNGIHEFWIDGKLEARRTGLNFVGTYTDYGINAVYLENYWNGGSPKQQERYFDSFVVSTKRIGCLCSTDN
jgi:hypothetical protein